MEQRQYILSIRPQWMRRILSGEKCLEVRLSRPQRPVHDAVVWLYETKAGEGRGRIIGRALVSGIRQWNVYRNPAKAAACAKMSCMSVEQMENYQRGHKRVGKRQTAAHPAGGDRVCGNLEAGNPGPLAAAAGTENRKTEKRSIKYPFFPGISVPNHTAARLEELNAREVDYGGKQYTRYEIRQMQRELERQVRRAKRRYLAEKAAGADTARAAMQLRDARRKLNAFLEDTGGKVDGSRTDVAGFGYAQARETTRLVQQAEREYTQKQEAARQTILSPDTPKSLNVGNQRKHIREEGRDIGSRSFLYGTMEDAQALVDRYSGTGEPKLDGNGNWTHKEFVTADYLVGESVNPETGIATPTHRFAIHYGKRGTHVVPMGERKT